MSNKIIVAIIILALVVMAFCTILSVVINKWREDVNENKQIIQQEEVVVLKDVSKRTGKEFSTWLELREYVFCTLLKKGMTHDEVYEALSTIGEVSTENNSANYQNKYLNEYLSPIHLVYSYEDPARGLSSWSGSPETHFWVEKASCEKK